MVKTQIFFRNRRGTVRIYLAPRYDEKGARLTFEQQRLHTIELDSFRVRRMDHSSLYFTFQDTLHSHTHLQ